MNDFYSLTPELGGMTEVAMYEASRLFGRACGYYEFGLFKGYNLARAIGVGRSISGVIEYHGFDSFKGMPENNTGYEPWHKGAYAASKAEVDQHLRAVGGVDSVWLHEGWFSHEWFSELQVQRGFPPAGVVVVDCDLYESTVPVLEFVYPLFRVGTVILLDDWTDQPGDGERRAWLEFIQRHPFEYDEYNYGRFSHHVTIRGIG